MKNIKHPNDRSFTYGRIIFPGLLHKYLKLPGEYERSYPTTIITRDIRKLEMDWLIFVKADGKTLSEDMLINVEQQSTEVRLSKIKDIADYRDYSKTQYGLPVLSVIVTTFNPKNSIHRYETTKTDILEPIYIYFKEEEIKKRLNNLKTKIGNNEKLMDEETLDIAFLPFFTPMPNAKHITREVCQIYNKSRITNEKLKQDISHILEIMIYKNFDDKKEIKELLKLTFEHIRENAINEIMKESQEEIEELKNMNESLENMNQELKNEKEELKNEKEELKNENYELKKGFDELKKLGKLDEESIQIINSLILSK